MPYREVHQDVECEVVYCDHWFEGECQADEPASECAAWHSCYHKSMGSTLNAVNISRCDAPIRGKLIPLLKVPSVVSYKGEDGVERLGDGENLYAVFMKTYSDYHVGLFFSDDLEGVGFYPSVNGGIGWSDLNQIDMLQDLGL